MIFAGKNPIGFVQKILNLKNHPQETLSQEGHQQVVLLEGLRITFNFVRHLRARNYIMRLQKNGAFRVTIPRSGSRRGAEQFVLKNRDWILRQSQKHAADSLRFPEQPWTNGSRVYFRGEAYAIRIVNKEDGKSEIEWAGHRIKLREEIAPADIRAGIESLLKQIAREELPAQLARLARAHHLSYARVSIRGQKSRWGSCSSRKTISLNWRLVQTPPFVQEYILIHELMHLREMNHSSRFWKHVEAACPGYRAAEKWLKGHRLLAEV